jgi:hypothetical protein
MTDEKTAYLLLLPSQEPPRKKKGKKEERNFIRVEKRVFSLSKGQGVKKVLGGSWNCIKKIMSSV